MRTRRAARQIDRTTAIRAVDDLDILTELRELARRERLDEVFFAEEVEERDEASVTAVAAPVFEGRVALAVVGRQKTRLAARTVQDRTDRGFRPTGQFANPSEQLQRRAG